MVSRTGAYGPCVAPAGSASCPGPAGYPLNCPPKMFAEGALSKSSAITCKEGVIEKWTFYNPTADFHPMHWHLNHVQCFPTGKGPTTAANELKDTVPIPNAAGKFTAPTLICYVPCAAPQVCAAAALPAQQQLCSLDLFHSMSLRLCHMSQR